MSITLIAAVASNGIIGKDNSLLWRLPADMAFFKSQTLGKPVLMGRKTFESLPSPLKDRTNIILSRVMTSPPEGCVLVGSLAEAFERYGDQELMVIGGADIYAQAIDKADRLIITEIEQAFDGDTSFPLIDSAKWKLVSRTPGVLDERNKLAHSFCVYERQ
nr:Dihydrofolate reductase [uncultured bacterium]AIA13568.1 Dihydrofolate reductase [uncultured bacterium]